MGKHLKMPLPCSHRTLDVLLGAKGLRPIYSITEKANLESTGKASPNELERRR